MQTTKQNQKKKWEKYEKFIEKKKLLLFETWTSFDCKNDVNSCAKKKKLKYTKAKDIHIKSRAKK